MNNKSLPDGLREMISEKVRKARLGVLSEPQCGCKTVEVFHDDNKRLRSL